MRPFAIPARLSDAAALETASRASFVRGLLWTAIAASPCASAAQSAPDWSAARPNAAVVSPTAASTATLPGSRATVRSAPALPPLASPSVLPPPSAGPDGQIGALLVRDSAGSRSTHSARAPVADRTASARSTSVTAATAPSLAPRGRPGAGAARTAGAASARTSMQTGADTSMIDLQSVVARRSAQLQTTTNVMGSLDSAMQNVTNDIGRDGGTSRKPCGPRCPNAAPVHLP